jgi:hypothetical protein
VISSLAQVMLVLAVASSGSGEGALQFRLNHRKHLALPALKKDRDAACARCHTVTPDSDAKRPAASDHRACDSADCHASEWYGQKAEGTEVCLVCHKTSTFWGDMSALRPFPPRPEAKTNDYFLDRLEYYAEFSHKRHLGVSGGNKESVVGKITDEGCLFCHKINLETKEVTRPGHGECQTCHTETSKIPMSKCRACHQARIDDDGHGVRTGPVLRSRATRVSRKFSHEKHRLDRRKREPVGVSCGVCHTSVAEAETLGAIEVTSGSKTMVNACGSCHKDGQKTASGHALFTISGKCTACHDSLADAQSTPATHRVR